MNAFTNLFMVTDKSVSLAQDTAIGVYGLSAGYGAETIVQDVNFEVQSGERLAIIGPNGAGKSTLIKAMLGLLKPQSGSVRFLNRPFTVVRQHVAYVAQADEIDWRFPSTVRDLVAMGRGVHLGLTGRLGAGDWRAVERALKSVNILDLADRPLSDLSGGQRRRVLLARALVQEPQILIMDEPFQAIDEATREALLKVLDDFQDEGKTAVIVHHNLADVRTLFDRALLVDGTVTAMGTPDDVLQSPAFASAFGAIEHRAV
ncbi:MAG: metal ABC transporter ATP-binding protein [Alphaproteobacteria bacterium]